MSNTKKPSNKTTKKVGNLNPESRPFHVNAANELEKLEYTLSVLEKLVDKITGKHIDYLVPEYVSEWPLAVFLGDAQFRVAEIRMKLEDLINRIKDGLYQED